MISLIGRPCKCLLDMYKTSNKFTIVREQSWTIWGANVLIWVIPKTKPWKILLVCTILIFFQKIGVFVVEAWGGYRWKMSTLSLWWLQHWAISNKFGLPYHLFWKKALFLKTTLKWTEFLLFFDYFLYFISTKTWCILILASMFCSGVRSSSISTRLLQKRKLDLSIFLFVLSVTSFNCLSTLLRESISLFWSVFPYPRAYFLSPGFKDFQTIATTTVSCSAKFFLILLKIVSNIWYYIMIFLIGIILKKPHYIIKLPGRQLTCFSTLTHYFLAISLAPRIRFCKVFPNMLWIIH